MLSAALAYYAAVSLFPLCLVLMAGIGWLSRISSQWQNQQQHLLLMVERNASPWVAEQLANLLKGIETNAAWGGPFGLATLVLAAMGIFVQLNHLFDRVWHVTDQRPSGLLSVIRLALAERLLAFLMLLGVGGSVIIVFVLNLALSALRPYLWQWLSGPLLWRMLQLGLTTGLNALLLAVVFKVLPRAAVGWRPALAGGLLTAVTWQIGMRVLESWIISDHYTAYGVVGSFLAVLLWMYYASAFLFLGAEFVRAVSITPAEPAQKG